MNNDIPTCFYWFLLGISFGAGLVALLAIIVEMVAACAP